VAGTIVLTPDQIVRINQARRELADAIADTVKLMKCGVECEQRKVEAEQLTAKLEALIQNFAPPGS
jgi:hypothetical protein